MFADRCTESLTATIVIVMCWKLSQLRFAVIVLPFSFTVSTCWLGSKNGTWPTKHLPGSPKVHFCTDLTWSNFRKKLSPLNKYDNSSCSSGSSSSSSNNSKSVMALNMTLSIFAAECKCHSYRLISPVHRALSNRPAGHCCCCQLMGRTEGRPSIA